jgi:excisionase family DNA binding protein
MSVTMHTTAPGVYTIDEAAEHLTCSRTHVYRLISSGQLRAIDISVKGAKRSKTRVLAADLAAYIQQATQT